MIPRTVLLNNGVEIPLLGLGTYTIRGDPVKRAVETALKSGYRHIDTASIYKNEKEIGEAIKNSGVPRKDIFITSKVGPSEQGFNEAIKAFNRSINALDVEYLDLYIIHWPGVQGEKRNSPKNTEIRLETWKALEQLYKEGKCRAIGVSNFEISHLEQLLKIATVVPAINQCEFHPLLPQESLRNYCKSKGILFEAYSSLAQGALLDDPIVSKIAAECKTTTSNVLLRWAIQQGIPVLPRSAKAPHIESNIDVWKVSLTEHQMLLLSELHKSRPQERFCWDPTDVV